MKLSARDRRALWIGGGIVLAAIAWRGVASVETGRLAMARAEADRGNALLAREQRLIRDSAELSATLQSARRALRRAPVMYQGTLGDGVTPHVAGWLRERAVAAGLNDVQSAVSADRPLGEDLHDVSITIRGAGTPAAASRWIAAVETFANVTIDALDVSAQGGGLIVTARIREVVRELRPGPPAPEVRQ